MYMYRSPCLFPTSLLAAVYIIIYIYILYIYTHYIYSYVGICIYKIGVHDYALHMVQAAVEYTGGDG